MAMSCPTLKGAEIFRKNELVYINRCDELMEYCNVIHKHDFIEIAYVIAGTGIHIMGNQRYETSKGDLFVINYDVPHGFFPREEGGPAPVVYNCVFKPEFLDASLFSSNHFQDITSSFLFKSLFPYEANPGPDLTLRGIQFHEIGELFRKMYTEYKLMQKGYTDILRAFVIELVIKIFRYISSGPSQKSTSRNAELVARAVEYMKQNYNTDIKLEDVALQSFISKNYFSRLFREVTGINFSDYIQQLRIDEACSLLKDTDMKVLDIALTVGFRDLKFFYEVFKKITGQTPGDFRKHHKLCLQSPRFL